MKIRFLRRWRGYRCRQEVEMADDTARVLLLRGIVAAVETAPMTAEALSLELWTQSDPAGRCPHLARDAAGCLCQSPACPEDGRRLVVDHLSLQLWCLDRERAPKCIFYPRATAFVDS